MKTVFFTAALWAALMLTGPGSTVPEGMGREVLVYSASDTREDCLENCRQWIDAYGGRRRRGGGYNYRNRMYQRCVAKCERQFWKEWDREMGVQ